MQKGTTQESYTVSAKHYNSTAISIARIFHKHRLSSASCLMPYL